jgi:hypothetical protein
VIRAADELCVAIAIASSGMAAPRRRDASAALLLIGRFELIRGTTSTLRVGRPRVVGRADALAPGALLRWQ